MQSFRERFPPPWRAEKTEGGHYVVKDADDRHLVYVYVDRVGSAATHMNKVYHFTDAEALALATAVVRMAND